MFWQLFDSLLPTENGGLGRFVWSLRLFPIVQTSIDGRWYAASTNKASWKSLDVEVSWIFFRFIVLCDSLLSLYWTENGVGQICLEYGAVSDRADIDRRELIFVHEQGFMEIIRRRSLMNLSSFHCFVRFPPTRTSDKKSITQRTAEGNETLGLDGSSSRQQCWGTTLSDTTRRKTWHRNLEYSTESEAEE